MVREVSLPHLGLLSMVRKIPHPHLGLLSMVEGDATGLVRTDCVACVMQSEHVSKLVRIPGIVTAASKPKVGQPPPSLHTTYLALVLRPLNSRVTRYNLNKMQRLPSAVPCLSLGWAGQGRAGQGRAGQGRAGQGTGRHI